MIFGCAFYSSHFGYRINKTMMSGSLKAERSEEEDGRNKIKAQLWKEQKIIQSVELEFTQLHTRAL